jgi:hypothetical protein
MDFVSGHPTQETKMSTAERDVPGADGRLQPTGIRRLLLRAEAHGLIRWVCPEGIDWSAARWELAS